MNDTKNCETTENPMNQPTPKDQTGPATTDPKAPAETRPNPMDRKAENPEAASLRKLRLVLRAARRSREQD